MIIRRGPAPGHRHQSRAARRQNVVVTAPPPGRRASTAGIARCRVLLLYNITFGRSIPVTEITIRIRYVVVVVFCRSRYIYIYTQYVYIARENDPGPRRNH